MIGLKLGREYAVHSGVASLQIGCMAITRPSRAAAFPPVSLDRVSRAR